MEEEKTIIDPSKVDVAQHDPNPAMRIMWNPKTQEVHCSWDNTQILNIDHAVLCLEGALSRVKFMQGAARMASLQQQQMQAMQDMQIKSQLARGKR
jgi:hypothetical protein